MAQLAIKGHENRGKEVIEILEMLGGINVLENCGNNTKVEYYINTVPKKWICCDKMCHLDDYIILNLEEFFEKFPYKVGDKVIYEDKVREVTKMVWEEQTNTVAYKLDDKLYCNVIKELQPYKEETMEGKIESFEILESHCADEVKIEFDPSKFKMVERDNGYYVVKKKPQYPKTYEECCEILELESKFTIDDLTVDEKDFLKSIIKLKGCRDAYWMIAGEWKYDVNKTEEYFYIVNKCGHIVKEHYMNFNHFLAFPTAEMRDAFYENFKDLIEQCKELL